MPRRNENSPAELASVLQQAYEITRQETARHEASILAATGGGGATIPPEPRALRFSTIHQYAEAFGPNVSLRPPSPPPLMPKFPDWREREQWMFAEGIYKKVPWHAEPWAQRDETAHHYVHIAEKDPTMVAFIRGVDKAESKTPHVTLKPGRYLKKYFGDLLAPTTISHWASQVRGDGTQLGFADDITTVKAIYAKGGLSACMSHVASHYTGSVYSPGCKHPLEIYLLAGLRLAYIETHGEITARALVWPEKMLHTRAYGDTQAITKALANAGYKAGLFDGLKLPAIPLSEAHGINYRDCFLMPFIDHIKWAKKDSQTWSIPGVGVVESLVLCERATDSTYYVQTTEAVAYPISSNKGTCWDTSRTWRDEHSFRVAAECGVVAASERSGGEGGVSPPMPTMIRDFGNGLEPVMRAEDTDDDTYEGIVYTGEDGEDEYTFFGDQRFFLESNAYYRLVDFDCVKIYPAESRPQEQPQPQEDSPNPNLYLNHREIARHSFADWPLSEDFYRYNSFVHLTLAHNMTSIAQSVRIDGRTVVLLPTYRLCRNLNTHQTEICSND